MTYGKIHAIQVFNEELKTINLSDFFCISCCLKQFNSGILVSSMSLSSAYSYDSACVEYDNVTGVYTATEGTVLFFLKWGHLARKDNSDYRPLLEGQFGQQYLLDRKRCSECAVKLCKYCVDYGNNRFNEHYSGSCYYHNAKGELVRKTLKTVYANRTGHYTRLSGNIVNVAMQWVRCNGEMERAYVTLSAYKVLSQNAMGVTEKEVKNA